jgi:hypothetical protein
MGEAKDGSLAAQVTTGTVIAGSDGTNVQQIKTDADGNLQVDVLSGGGGADATAGSAVIATGPQIMGSDGTDARRIKTDAAGELQVDVLSIAAGNNNIGDIDVASIAAGSTLIGDVGLQPRTSGGLTTFRSIDLDETEEEIKATAGQVYWLYVANLATSIRYLKLYNATAANVIVGTTVPTHTIPIPASSAGPVQIAQGLVFDTAITAAATTGVADNDTGAPAANDVVINVGYK